MPHRQLQICSRGIKDVPLFPKQMPECSSHSGRSIYQVRSGALNWIGEATDKVAAFRAACLAAQPEALGKIVGVRAATTRRWHYFETEGLIERSGLRLSE